MNLRHNDKPQLMVRLSGRLELLPPQFLYEGNNIRMRYWLGLRQLGVMPGKLIAMKWRILGRQRRKLFVLRDSLLSQQDNFILHFPYALMLPPAWIIVTMKYPDAKAVKLPSINDDQGWSAFSSPEELFGRYPLHPAVFENATKSIIGFSKARKRTMAVRSGLKILAGQMLVLKEARIYGQEEVARVGAELISASDRAYFSADVRRSSIVPILVENPNDYEVEQGKGFSIPQNTASDRSLRKSATVTLLQRRLEDGDIALERYDLSNENEVLRVLRLLEQLIPDSKGGKSKVWLWVTGPLDHTQPHDISGENALPYLQNFRRALQKMKINHRRLEIISKPDLDVSNLRQGQHDLRTNLQAHWSAHSIPSVNVTSRKARELIS